MGEVPLYPQDARSLRIRLSPFGTLSTFSEVYNPVCRVTPVILHIIIFPETSCAIKASTRRTGAYNTCGPIAPYSGRDCVKSLRSSYTGLYPQTFGTLSTFYQDLGQLGQDEPASG